MSETMTLEIIRVAPTALWVLFAVFVYLGLRTAIRPQLNRLSTVRAPGIEMSFAAQLLDEASRKHEEDMLTTEESAGARGAPAAPGEASGEEPLPLPPAPSASQRRAAVSRLEHAAEFMRDGRILWVDDHPERNSPLIDLFRQVGMSVTTAATTSEAMSLVSRHAYDLIISDMHRAGERPSNGAANTLADELARTGARVPMILYTGRHFNPGKGVHPGLFAYTRSGDSLVQYVIDIMERIKFGVGVRVPRL